MLTLRMIRISKAKICWILEIICRAALLPAGAIWMAFLNKNDWTWLGITSAASVLIVGLSMWLSGKQRRSLEKNARTAAVRRLLHALGASFEEGGAHHVRCNVMLSDKKRQVRKVDGETAYHMTGDPDENMEMEMFKGVSGAAAKQRETMMVDLTKDSLAGASGWGLKKSKTKQVRKSIKTIISCPIFDPEDRHGHLLGTIQVDSDEEFDTLIPDKMKAARIATAFGDAMSFVLKS